MRIASLSPAVTEVLFILGLGDQIICTDADAFGEYEPELVFTSSASQEKLAEELKVRGLSVIHQDPRIISEIYGSIREIGMMLQVDEAAEALVLKMQQGFNDVKRKGGLLPSHPRVYVEECPAFAPASAKATVGRKATVGKYDPPRAGGYWVPEVVRIAGGESFPIPVGEPSREVTLKEVNSFDPDLIVISWCGAGNLAEKKLLMERLPELRAVQEGHVYVIDDEMLNRPGPRLVEGAQRLYGWMFEMLH